MHTLTMICLNLLLHSSQPRPLEVSALVISLSMWLYSHHAGCHIWIILHTHKVTWLLCTTTANDIPCRQTLTLNRHAHIDPSNLAHARILIHTHTHADTHEHIHTHTSTHTHTHTHTHTEACVSAHNTHTHTHTHTHECTPHTHIQCMK